MIRTQNIDQLFYLTPDLFKQFAIHFYEHQAINGAFYQQFISMLGKANRPINALEDIPFLPVRFFKNHQIITSEVEKINPQASAVLFKAVVPLVKSIVNIWYKMSGFMKSRLPNVLIFFMEIYNNTVSLLCYHLILKEVNHPWFTW